MMVSRRKKGGEVRSKERRKSVPSFFQTKKEHGGKWINLSWITKHNKNLRKRGATAKKISENSPLRPPSKQSVLTIPRTAVKAARHQEKRHGFSDISDGQQERGNVSH